MKIQGIFEPEETAGKVWHGLAVRVAGDPKANETAVYLPDIRSSLAFLFRALGGSHDVDIGEAPAERVRHRRRWRRRLAYGHESVARASFDGDRLRLPPFIDAFSTSQLNKSAYFWMTAVAAGVMPEDLQSDCEQVNTAAVPRVLESCPGLRYAYAKMREECLRPRRLPPLPFWVDVLPPPTGGAAPSDADPEKASPPAAAVASVKSGERRDLDQADRKDSFIVHRFDTILSWAESMDINRTVEDDDNANKAADDLDNVTLSKHHKKTASRLHLHLDLSPADAEHERLSGEFTYPEWNQRRQIYMDDHCRVFEAEAYVRDDADLIVDHQAVHKVRRQFEALRSRRIFEKRQKDGAELDLDALIEARADLKATGRSSDRIYVDSRTSQRDLSVALLLDVSRSTEADVDGSSVLDVSRRALASLAHGLDACGDQFGIWSFSSLRRSRVYVSRCKGFDEAMSARVDARIASLQPGHYTRLGAAIRHIAWQLDKQPSAQKLLLVLTDGKPNDIDHYEGKHGIEDSRMAVREARRLGQVVHGVIVDEDGQDWFARLFERSGFTLLPNPQRLAAALPDIYRSLTREF